MFFKLKSIDIHEVKSLESIFSNISSFKITSEKPNADTFLELL